jgi:hypothetical protein
VFELEGSGYYNVTTRGPFTIWMANYSGGSVLELAAIPADGPATFFVNVTVPSRNLTAPFATGAYEFWSTENYTSNQTCANYPFDLTATPPSSIGCLSWAAHLSVTTPTPANGSAGDNVSLQGRGFSFMGSISIYWANATGSPETSVGTASASTPYGWFNTTIPVPSGYAAGLYAFWAIDGDSDCAGAVFNLTSSAVLVVYPTADTPYSLVATTGSNFAADSTISFTFDGQVVTSSCSTDATGTFPGTTGTPCTFTVPEVPNGDDGGQNVIATDLSLNTASASFAVTPEISLSPSEGVIGSTFTVTGVGFSPDPSAPYLDFNDTKLTPTGGSDCNHASQLIEADTNGVFVCTFTVAVDSKPGANLVEGDDSNSGDLTAFRIFTVTTPTLLLTPMQGPSGTLVVASGSGFSAGVAITSAISSGGVIGSASSCNTNSLGSFGGCSFTVSGPVNVYTINASGSDVATVPADAAGNTFTVTPDLVITSSPLVGPPGTSVTVTGSDFTPGWGITFVQIGITYLTVVDVDFCQGTPVDAAGGFTCTFAVPQTGAGVYTVFASGGGPDTGITSSTNTFAVTGPAVGSVSSTSGAPGPVTFSISGLAPTTVFYVYLDSVQGVASTASYNPLGSCTSSASGAIAACTVDIPAGLPAGTYFVDLFQDPAPPPFVLSVFSFTVATAHHPSASLIPGLPNLDLELIGVAVAIAAIGAAAIIARRRVRRDSPPPKISRTPEKGPPKSGS